MLKRLQKIGGDAAFAVSVEMKYKAEDVVRPENGLLSGKTRQRPLETNSWSSTVGLQWALTKKWTRCHLSGDCTGRQRIKAITRPSRYALSFLLALVVTAGCGPDQKGTVAANAEEASKAAMAQKARALYEEKCKTVAGEKIYRTVPEVEGILLLKVRPQAGDREWADLMWPGAAFALESRVDEYINTFLGFEHPLQNGLTGKITEITPESRGQIGVLKRPGGLPGYRYVDVTDEKDGKRYRYTGSNKAVRQKDITAPNVQLAMKNDPNYDLNVYQWTLDKTPGPNPSPRYGVTFEDHVIPEERALGVASSTVKVVDLKTNEVLGELTRYAWGSTMPSNFNPSPWLTAAFCPKKKIFFDIHASTRQFVDQVLIPKRGK